MYNTLLKKIVFPSFSIYFFPHFFPSPNPNFGASSAKMGIFSILKIGSLFLSLFIYFFPIFAHPQIQISVYLGEKWGWTPHFLYKTHFKPLASMITHALYFPILKNSRPTSLNCHPVLRISASSTMITRRPLVVPC